jgi:hypothetical protein
MSLNGIIFILEFSVSVGTIATNVFGLGEGGDFQHPPRRIDAESLFLINHKPLMICGALNRHFCQTRPMFTIQ